MVVPKTRVLSARSFEIPNAEVWLSLALKLPLPKGKSCENKMFSDFHFVTYTLAIGFT